MPVSHLSVQGFRETDYDDSRAKLKDEGTRLRSLVNDKDYGIGDLELVSLQSLRERVKSTGGLPGSLKVSVVTGDVRHMHQSPENAGALFQVASQFNLLEMIGPEVTPEQGVTRYQYDRTQGPACAIAAGAATIYRNYFAPVGGGYGQTEERQFDGLADLGECFSTAFSMPVASLWRMQNGYALCTRAVRATPVRQMQKDQRQAGHTTPRSHNEHRASERPPCSRKESAVASCLSLLAREP
jgi:hypothetical protein